MARTASGDVWRVCGDASAVSDTCQATSPRSTPGASTLNGITPIDPVVVAERLAQLRADIDRLAGNRPVEIVAVTKGFGPDAVRAAVAAGCPMIGENYAQELLVKLAAVADLGPLLDVHFIGRLQSNKVRLLTEVVGVWESVDRASLLDEIAKRRPGATVLVQVNATGDSSKGGCAPRDVEALVGRGLNLNLDVNGVMTVGPTDGDRTAARNAFEIVAALSSGLGLPTCSMGMTQDLEIAIECGSTRVRVGTALFGPREPR